MLQKYTGQTIMIILKNHVLQLNAYFSTEAQHMIGITRTDFLHLRDSCKFHKILNLNCTNIFCYKTNELLSCFFSLVTLFRHKIYNLNLVLK